MSFRPWPYRRLRIALALALGAGAVATSAASGKQASPVPANHPPLVPGAGDTAVARGRSLFVDGCSSCHGLNAQGIPHRGPSLHGVGALAADFELSTGRMPLDAPGDQPLRHKPVYNPPQIGDLTAYIASFGGPPIPYSDPAAGNISDGMRVFADNCAGCHQIIAQGGMTTGARVPALQHATNTQIAEAVRLGPYLMPVFSAKQVDQHDLDSLARYIAYTRAPYDKGGWGIGHIGPIPEGMVTWLLAGVTLLLVIRLIGERTTR